MVTPIPAGGMHADALSHLNDLALLLDRMTYDHPTGSYTAAEALQLSLAAISRTIHEHWQDHGTMAPDDAIDVHEVQRALPVARQEATPR